MHQAEQQRADDASTTEHQQDQGHGTAAQAGDAFDEGFDVAVGGELRGNGHCGQHIERHQRRTLEQQRQTAQGAGVLAGQQRQGAPQPEHQGGGERGDHQEGSAPAHGLAQQAAQGNAQHHRQGCAGGQQAKGLHLLALWRQAYSQRSRDRPEQRMGQGDADPTDHQQAEAGGDAGEDMAGDKQTEQHNQQFAPFDVAGQQHHRQRGQRHDPRINGEHQADAGHGHIKAGTNGAEQPDGDKFCGIEHKRGQRKGDDRLPIGLWGCG